MSGGANNKQITQIAQIDQVYWDREIFCDAESKKKSFTSCIPNNVLSALLFLSAPIKRCLSTVSFFMMQQSKTRRNATVKQDKTHGRLACPSFSSSMVRFTLVPPQLHITNLSLKLNAWHVSSAKTLQRRYPSSHYSGGDVWFMLHLIKYVYMYEHFLGRQHWLPSFQDAPCLCTLQFLSNVFIVYLLLHIGPH